MPVLRAELLRSVYRRYFTNAGKVLGRLAGARDLTEDVLKEWFYYFYQCTECRRCSVFCPYGIDQAEITMLGRELLNLVGCNIHWAMEPAANCFRTGNHLGIQPHGVKDMLDFIAQEIEDQTGIHTRYSHQQKRGGDPFCGPFRGLFCGPGNLHLHGLSPAVPRTRPQLYLEHLCFRRGELRSVHFPRNDQTAERQDLRRSQASGRQMDHRGRMRPHVAGAPPIHGHRQRAGGLPKEPVSPITGTKFENARSTKMVHIAEFTADLIHHRKLRLDPRRNDHLRLTFHDSCNPSRAMGLFEEPRYILRNVCNHFYEMPENTIREKTFCCGSGAGLGTDENMEMRLRGGFPGPTPSKYVKNTG